MPGYYLHIHLIKLVKLITLSTHSAMVWLNLLYSAFGAVFTYNIFRKFIEDQYAILLTIVIMTNPMTWYYGCSVGVYPFDLFYSTLIVFMCMDRRMIYLTPAILTLGAGVRQSSGFFMLPVIIYFFVTYYKHKELKLIPTLISLLFAMAGFLVWLLPMLDNAGGFISYLSLFQKNSPLSMRHAFIKNLTNAITYGLYILIPILVIFISIFFKKNKPYNLFTSIKIEGYSNMSMIILLWPLPIIIFFLLFVYSKGYFLICITGVLFIAAHLLKHQLINVRGLVVIIVLQTTFFVCMPYHAPELYVNMAPDKRQSGKIDAWIGRLSNVFMLSQNAIRKREHYGNEINKCINHLEKDSYLDKNTIFIDPSFQIKARVLQAIYPDIRFAFLNVFEKDSYFLLYYSKFSTKYDLRQLLNNSIVITSQESYEKFLINRGYTLIFLSSDIVCFSPKNNIESIVELYNDYYLNSQSNN